MMAVFDARLEAGRVAGAEAFLAFVLHEPHFSFEHVDEFVLVCVPMALARPGAGRQPCEVDPELGETCGDTELHVFTRAAGLVEGSRVACATPRGRGGSVDFGHVLS